MLEVKIIQAAQEGAVVVEHRDTLPRGSASGLGSCTRCAVPRLVMIQSSSLAQVPRYDPDARTSKGPGLLRMPKWKPYCCIDFHPPPTAPNYTAQYTIYRAAYYTILYYTILYYTILYYTILYCTILYYTILYYTILYYTILYYTILYYTMYIDYMHIILQFILYTMYYVLGTTIYYVLNTEY